MENCIFCKIISREIPCHSVHENKNFLAFLDIRPTNKGHTLIIPKKHYRWVWDVQEEYSQFTNQVAKAIKKAFHTDYVVSFVMGDEVAHAHIHLVPRFPHDGHDALINLHNIKSFSDIEMEDLASKIREAIY